MGHISPEAADGGPIVLVENGDIISINIPERRLELKASEEELAKRRQKWAGPKVKEVQGYLRLYAQNASPEHERARIKR